jgi:two-component system sensor histidine kinase/response regulator
MHEPINQSDPQNQSVLIVDDNPKNLQLMSAVLRQKGYKLYLTNSGDNALQLLEKITPDLILLDVMMPGMSGFDVCRKIKAQEKFDDTPVVFLTAKNEVEDIVEGFTAGAVDYIVKPFKSAEVFVRISTHLQLKQARQMLAEKNQKLEELNNSLKQSNATIEADARRLAQLNAEKNKFFSIIAHDLRGPFTGLIGLTDLLNSQIDNMPAEEVKEMLGLLAESSNQVFSLLENLLEWSRVQMNAVSFTPELCLLKPLITHTLHHFQTQAGIKNIKLTTEVDENLTIMADGIMLKTVIRNLISNAIKFTPRNGEVRIFTQKIAEDKWQLAVSDSGIGMPPSLVEKLFSIEHKVSRPGTEGEASNGLGLLLCKGLVTRHGFDLHVESAEGKGSTFFITFTN